MDLKTTGHEATHNINKTINYGAQVVFHLDSSLQCFQTTIFSLALAVPCRECLLLKCVRPVFLLLCTIHSAVWNIFNVIELHTAASSRVKIQKHSSQKEAMAANLIQNPLTYKYKKLLQTLIKLLRKMASWGRSCLCSAKSTIIDQYLFLAWQPPPPHKSPKQLKRQQIPLHHLQTAHHA